MPVSDLKFENGAPGGEPPPVENASTPTPVAPPPAPAAPAPQPIRYVDEGLGDVSGKAVAAPTYFVRHLDDVPRQAPSVALPVASPATPSVQPVVPAVEPPKAVEPLKVAEPVKEPTKEPEKEVVYAGKFKSIEELEKAYKEAEKGFHEKAQEAAEVRKQAQAAEKDRQAASSKTAEQIAGEKKALNDKLLAEFVADPDTFMAKAGQRFAEQSTQQTMTALQTQKTVETWKRDNSDLVPYEFYVGAEVTRLMQTNPNSGLTPDALLAQATANFRQIAGALRNAGATEALTTKVTVIPLTAPPSSPPGSDKAETKPLTAEAAFDMHMRYLKDIEKRNTRR